MKGKVVYFVAYYGDNKHLCWDADKERFVPAGLWLYISTWDILEDAMRAARIAKKKCSGWVDDIYIDSKICYC